MQNKTVLITGGNSGIGKYTVEHLARQGAEIVLAARNLSKAEEAVQEIRNELGEKARIHLIEMDLADLASVKRAAETFRASWNRLDVLINNAGLIASRYQPTAQGFETTFGVNHLGHFLLTQLLIPVLSQAPEPRIVNVSSKAYLFGKLDVNRLQQWPGRYNGYVSYAQSKLCNVLFTKELAKRYPGIASNALHPGVVNTPFGNKHTLAWESAIWSLYRPFAFSPERGAQTSIFLASSPQVAGISGSFFDEKQKQRRLAPNAQSDAVSQQLWDLSAKWTQAYQ